MTHEAHHVKESKCLDCGKALDAATGAFTQDSPDPGDITVCLYCGHIMAFATDLSLRPLTDAEIVEIAGDPRIIKIQKARARL